MSLGTSLPNSQCCVSILAHKVLIVAYAALTNTSVAMVFDAKNVLRGVTFICSTALRLRSRARLLLDGFGHRPRKPNMDPWGGRQRPSPVCVSHNSLCI